VKNEKISLVNIYIVEMANFSKTSKLNFKQLINFHKIYLLFCVLINKYIFILYKYITFLDCVTFLLLRVIINCHIFIMPSKKSSFSKKASRAEKDAANLRKKEQNQKKKNGLYFIK
jgi:hypothetical protein